MHYQLRPSTYLSPLTQRVQRATVPTRPRCSIRAPVACAYANRASSAQPPQRTLSSFWLWRRQHCTVRTARGAGGWVCTRVSTHLSRSRQLLVDGHDRLPLSTPHATCHLVRVAGRVARLAEALRVPHAVDEHPRVVLRRDVCAHLCHVPRPSPRYRLREGPFLPACKRATGECGRRASSPS